MSDFSFDHIKLKDIDPSRKPVDEGFYTLQMIKSEEQEYDLKPFFKSGEPNPDYVEGAKGKYLNLTFAVTGDPKHSGRRLWLTLFPGDSTFKRLRKFMDAVDIPQADGQGIPAYLQMVAELQPPAEFKTLVKVIEKVDQTGEKSPANYVELFQAQAL